MTDKEKLVKELRDLRRYLEDKEWSDNKEDRKAASLYFETVTNAINFIKGESSHE